MPQRSPLTRSGKTRRALRGLRRAGAAATEPAHEEREDAGDGGFRRGGCVEAATEPAHEEREDQEVPPQPGRHRSRRNGARSRGAGRHETRDAAVRHQKQPQRSPLTRSGKTRQPRGSRDPQELGRNGARSRGAGRRSNTSGRGFSGDKPQRSPLTRSGKTGPYAIASCTAPLRPQRSPLTRSGKTRRQTTPPRPSRTSRNGARSRGAGRPAKSSW